MNRNRSLRKRITHRAAPRLNRDSALLLFAALSITSLASSQSPSTQPPSSPTPKPEFEVASIRQNITATEHDRSHIYSAATDGNYRTVNAPLKMLLESAFNLPEARILGVPSSIASAKFDIEAKSDAVLSQQLSKLPSDQGRAIKQQMLQALLADRFKLVTHMETRELPIYALVVAKNGPLIHPSQAGGTTINRGNNRISVQGSDNTVALLAEQLSLTLGRVVVDKTGLEGRYDITLKWTPDDASTSDASSGPSIFTAIQEQLGLKLESTKGPVQVLIIDHVEMPSEN
jgi:uncharacterized protein (TIGR03435 family)